MCGDGVGSIHRDIFNQQPDHAFSLPGWCLRIPPQSGEIGGQGQHTRALLGRQRRSIRGLLTVAAFLGLLQGKNFGKMLVKVGP